MPAQTRTVDEILSQAVEDGGFPGAVCAYGNGQSARHVSAVGRLTFEANTQPVTAETYFDLASLTKVLSTTPLCFHAVSNGLLSLDKRVGDVLPQAGSREATVRHLLTHSAGLPPYDHPLAEAGLGPEETRDCVIATPLVASPGDVTAYSCLGFIVLATMLEKVFGARIDQLFDSIVKPMTGLPAATYHLPPDNEVAPTDPSLARGVVHDPLARAMGGASGNAGLFGTVEDLVQAAAWWLDDDLAKEDWTKRSGPSSTRALGWDTKSEAGSSAGQLFGPTSFGHTGYTGTSLWIDPKDRSYVALLTNRVYPDDTSKTMEIVRPNVADASKNAFL